MKCAGVKLILVHEKSISFFSVLWLNTESLDCLTLSCLLAVWLLGHSTTENLASLFAIGQSNLFHHFALRPNLTMH